MPRRAAGYTYMASAVQSRSTVCSCLFRFRCPLSSVFGVSWLSQTALMPSMVLFPGMSAKHTPLIWTCPSLQFSSVVPLTLKLSVLAQFEGKRKILGSC